MYVGTYVIVVFNIYLKVNSPDYVIVLSLKEIKY